MYRRSLWTFRFVSAAWAGVAALICSTTGCIGPKNFEWPHLFHPGSLDYQRNAASLHDPYPDPDAGPQVVGGRPREFQKPLAEPVRNRWLTDSWWQKPQN